MKASNELVYELDTALSRGTYGSAAWLKMADIRVVTSMLFPEYREQPSLQARDVLVPWPDARSPRIWSVARCFAAFHVYVHLALFYASGCHIAPALEEPEHWHATAVKRFVTCFRRAEYLGCCMASKVGETALGGEGRLFRDELAAALRMLEGMDAGLTQSLEGMTRYELAR